ncbi:hypothetical protein [Hyalangium rubrum]|uniref:Uncharacterized protein n=1 Tax=Hyalangium rubrum TaxID=3103134 RepID=A0ABU5GVG5_9BACT|nr:hypothetical protein [Hyalangium sp. s54d21]MDY7225016.1 hypothetical protein [Hyalangium sp. s54d21]
MWRLLLLLSLLLGLLRPAVSHACSCADGPEVFPPEGTVPPNVTFLVGKLDSQKLLLLDTEGTQVPFRQETLGYRLVRLLPGSPLEEGKRYLLAIDVEQLRGRARGLHRADLGGRG